MSFSNQRGYLLVSKKYGPHTCQYHVPESDVKISAKFEIQFYKYRS